jgi:hypothetical protein
MGGAGALGGGGQSLLHIFHMGQAGQSSIVHQLLLYGTLITIAQLTDQSGPLTPQFFLVTHMNMYMNTHMNKYIAHKHVLKHVRVYVHA